MHHPLETNKRQHPKFFHALKGHPKQFTYLGQSILRNLNPIHHPLPDDREIEASPTSRLSGGGGRGSRASDGAANVVEVLDVVELDIQALDLPAAGGVGTSDDGKTPDLALGDVGADAELGVPDESDLLAIPGSNTFDGEGEVVGL